MLKLNFVENPPLFLIFRYIIENENNIIPDKTISKSTQYIGNVHDKCQISFQYGIKCSSKVFKKIIWN